MTSSRKQRIVANTSIETSTVRRLAARLEQDIRHRGLGAGDRYMTAMEVGEKFRVSTTTAHRALRVLADRDAVIRRHNRGTFVGPSLGRQPDSQVRMLNVYVLLPEDSGAGSTVCCPEFIDGIRGQMPGTNVQFSFLPSRDDVDYVHELLRSAGTGGQVAGIVAVSCGREVYRLLAEAGSPTVVFGSLYPGDVTLPSIDEDNHEAGRLLMRYLIEKGHRRVALFTPADSRPGDNAFLDGIHEVLQQAALPHGTMVMRSLPHEQATTAAAAKELLGSSNRPTAFIVRAEPITRVVASVAAEMGLDLPEAVEVVFQDQATWPVQRSTTTCWRRWRSRAARWSGRCGTCSGGRPRPKSAGSSSIG